VSDEALRYFFNPRSVAILGASRQIRKFGHTIFKNFVRSGYQGKVYPINPNATEILGQKVYPSLADIRGQVDLAVIALPAPIVLHAFQACIDKGVKAVVVISGGFKESGPEGIEREAALTKLAQESGVRLIGPNCIGVFDPRSQVDTLFLPSYRLKRPTPGDIAFITQSGAFGSAVLDWAASRNVGISKFVSFGNMADVSESELLEFLSKDPDTKCIVAYLEGVRDGLHFLEVARRVTVKKPLVILKGGTTSAGQLATLSHTGSLAGDPALISGIFSQLGIIQAHNVEGLFDVARALAYQPLPKGPRLAIVTNAGGFGVLASDHAERAGVPMVKLSEETREALKKVVPPNSSLSNPVDLTGSANEEDYGKVLNIITQDPCVDILLVMVLVQTSSIESDIVDILTEINEIYADKPLLACTVGGEYTEATLRMLEDNQIPSFPSPARAITAVKAIWDYAYYRKSLKPQRRRRRKRKCD
jgi:acetyl coenzyme A synthetase (ADP forming)-like protein